MNDEGAPPPYPSSEQRPSLAAVKASLAGKASTRSGFGLNELLGLRPDEREQA